MKGSGIAVSESAVAEAVVSARGMFGKLVAVKAKPAKPVVLVLPVAALKTSSPAQPRPVIRKLIRFGKDSACTYCLHFLGVGGANVLFCRQCLGG